MHLHSDFTRRVVVDTTMLPWIDSPITGIQRRLIERKGEEVARATSIVRYAPGSSFPVHTHEAGEEIFVLEGVFSDETGDFSPGMYIKNPPGSKHSPRSSKGCTILVKLLHLDSADTERVVIDTTTSVWLPGLVPGLSVIPLSEFATQHTALVHWAPGTRFKVHRHYGGEEIFVLRGIFADEHGLYPAGTWIRSPHMSTHCPFSDSGCIILVKTGHLPTDDTHEALS